MNLALWIIAGLLATVFTVGAAGKLILPKDKIVTMHGGSWVSGFSARSLKALGVIDLLAAVGLIAPAALDIAPVLVPIAAVGVVLLMFGAVIVRLRQGARKPIVIDLSYLALAALVAWGRFGPESFNG